MSNLQKALLEAPASVTATSLFDAKSGIDKQSQIQNVAGFMKAIEGLGDCTLKVLTAVNPEMIADRVGDYEHLNLPSGMPETQHDVMLQISARNRRDCQFVQRLATDVFEDHFKLVSEVVGGDVFLNQEPFGFYHADPEERDFLSQVSEIPSGDLQGGTWLMYQRWVQSLENFYALSKKDQVDTVGGDPVRTDFWNGTSPGDPVPADAHVKLMESPLDLPEMIRRGFAYRKDGDEGVVFVATAANVDQGFNAPLQRMAGGDRLLGFADAVEGGLYFVPSDGAWLDAGASVAPISNSAEELLVRQTDNQVLNMAEVLVPNQLLGLISGLFGSVLYPDRVDSQALELTKAINARAAGGTLQSVSVTGGDPEKTQRLNDILDKSIEEGARFNEIAGKYITIS